MAELLTAEFLIQRQVSARDRILLVNPPVEETRYSWIRWNQPLDLLKIGAFLRDQIGCNVELFDYMKPDPLGRVPTQKLRGVNQYRVLQGERFPMWHFGRPYAALRDWLSDRRSQAAWQQPTQVWITSLCSYWFQSVAQTCRAARQSLPEAKIVLLGQYPRLMPKHAQEKSGADLIVSDSLDLDDYRSAIELYGSEPPSFLALREKSKCSADDIKAALKCGIFTFSFFEDRLCTDGGETLRYVAELAEQLNKRIRFHLVCGLQPGDITPAIASVLARPQFAEIHFEEEAASDGLCLDSYRRARSYLTEAGFKIPDRSVSGFVWIGRPKEDLKVLISRAFTTVECLGSIILKPFTPTPHATEYDQYSKYLGSIPHQDWSPHFFPFAGLNGITHADYHDLYRVAAFLNEKVRGRSFDFLNGTLGARLLRESLRREVWKLEKGSLRASN